MNSQKPPVSPCCSTWQMAWKKINALNNQFQEIENLFFPLIDNSSILQKDKTDLLQQPILSMAEKMLLIF